MLYRPKYEVLCAGHWNWSLIYTRARSPAKSELWPLCPRTGTALQTAYHQAAGERVPV